MTLRDRLRPFYSVFRPIYGPILSSAAFRNLGLTQFDAFVRRASKTARFSDFTPRYPFATDRGPDAPRFHIADPNNRLGHEPDLAHLLDLLLPQDGVFLDVGSNYAYFAIYVATRQGFHGRVHAFEPVAHTFTEMWKLVRSLRCDDFVTGHNVAASDHNGTAQMLTGGIGLAHSSIAQNNTAIGETVKTAKLDSFDFDRVDFVKVDVEGHELQALRGAKNLIQRHQPFVFLESWYSPENPEAGLQPLQMLVDEGYQLFLPTWLQPDGSFFTGIGPDHAMKTLALLPFELKDRPLLPGPQINIFASPRTKVSQCGRRR